MTLAPITDNIIVKIKNDNEANVTPSGIIIATVSKEKQDQGEVVAVGSGRVLNNGVTIPMSVAQGDQVIFNKFAGSEIKNGDDLYVIIKENDILAIIKE